MKSKIFISLLCLLFLITGCTSNNLNSVKKIDLVLLEYIKTGEVNYNKLNKKEEKLVNNFIESEKEENKIVNLSSYSNLSDIDNSNNPTSFGVFEKDGKYYINYTDLEFMQNTESEFLEDLDTYVYEEAIVYYDGKVVSLIKDYVPLIPEDTSNHLRYNYAYRGTATYEDAIISYYNSLHDDTGMKIIYQLNNNKIDDIDIEFNMTDTLYMVENTSNNNVSIVTILLISIAIIGLVTGIVLIKVKKAQTI